MMDKAITIYQPHASLVGHEFKEFETRGWGTNYRGTIWIHAGKRPLVESLKELPSAIVTFINDLLLLDPENYPEGCLIARAELVECRQMTAAFIRSTCSDERMLGDWRTGRFAWKFRDVLLLDKPIPCRGMQGLWDIPPGVVA